MSKYVHPCRFHRLGLVLALLSLALAETGCVQRRMTIRSNPSGALVYVDDYEIGTTPVSTDYTYYGTRKIRLVKDGYETLTVYQPMPTPWYEWCGVDFFSENIWPGKIRDERAFDYQMTPMLTVPTEQLLGRAEQLRNASQVVPAAATSPVEASPPIVAPPPIQNAAPAIIPPATNIAPPPYSAVPNGTLPTYAPPGGTAPQVITPSGPPLSPGAVPSTPAPPMQRVLPPDWRPMGQAERDDTQKR